MDLKDQKINIRGINLNYVKTGNGEHPILLLPGTLGTIWSNFKHQVEKLDKNKFTIVAWEAPGYGKSRPPDRTISEDFLEYDATFARDLMEALGHKTFSAMGLCNGGRTCIALAAMYPDSIRKIILISTNSYMTPEEIKFYESTRNIDNWPEKAYQLMVENYGRDDLKSVWESWNDMLVNLCKKQNGSICTNLLERVQCPTLIVQGTVDRLVNPSHAEFLNTRIPHSRLQIFEGGHHLPQNQFADEFNESATNFLTSS